MNESDKQIIKEDIKNNVKKANWFLIGIAAFSVILSVNAIQPAHAEGEISVNDDYIGELKTKAAGVDDVGGIIYKVAAGTMAFGAGAKIFKRVVYA
jgi:hypothetical protein